MSEEITYGSYTFPSPTPLVGQSVQPVYIQGKVDHFLENISLIGTLTGVDLSGLHLQKMQMISGLLPEFKTLSITNGSSTTGFSFSKPDSITFDNSDLTTLLPYSISFTSYTDRSFSEFFGISNPVDNWSFKEQEGKITEVTHNVSAVGLKVNTSSALANAKNFVDSRVTGYYNLSLFQTGATGFLVSKNESIDKKENSYSITETYRYNTSEDPITNSGITTSETQISFEKNGGLSVAVDVSVQGSMSATRDGIGMLDTGVITADMASDIAVNAVVSSLSDYESGAYTFSQRQPSTVKYNVDTGSNKIDFSFTFDDPENLDQIGNVLHTRTATVSATKDDSKVTVQVNGDISYNNPFNVIPTGDPATGRRFLEVDSVFSGIQQNSGFLNLAIEAFQDFTGDATGYHISGDYMNPIPLNKSINKTPENSKITYSVSFDNRIDISSGTISGLKVQITDKKPIELSGIVPSLGGFAIQKLINRTAGEMNVSATCEQDTGSIPKLKDVISGHLTGVYTFAESSSVNENTLTFNMSRYY